MAEPTNTDDYPDQYYAEIRYKEEQEENSFYHWENSWCPKGPGSAIGWDKDGDVMPRETAFYKLRRRNHEYDWDKRRDFARQKMVEQANGLRRRSYSDSRLRIVEVADYKECPIEIADYEERPSTVGTPVAPTSDWSLLEPSYEDADFRPRIVDVAESPERPNTVAPLAPASNWLQLAPPGRTSNWADDDEIDDEVYFGFAAATAPSTAEPAASQPSEEAQVAPSSSPETSSQAAVSTTPAVSNIPATSDTSNSDHGMTIAILEAQLEDTQIELDAAQTKVRNTELSLETARKSYRSALSAQETSDQSTLTALAEADRTAEKYRLSAQRFNEEFIAAKNKQIELEKRLATMTKELEEEKERSKRYRKERDQQADKKERVEDKYDQAKAMVESTRHRLKEAEKKLAAEKAEKEIREAEAERNLEAEAERKVLEEAREKRLLEVERELREAIRQLEEEQAARKLREAEAAKNVEAEAEKERVQAEMEEKFVEQERELRESEEEMKARMAVEAEQKRKKDAEQEKKEAYRDAKPRRSELGLAMERCKDLSAKQRAILASPPKPIVPIKKWTRPVWSEEMKAYFQTIGYTIKE